MSRSFLALTALSVAVRGGLLLADSTWADEADQVERLLLMARLSVPWRVLVSRRDGFDWLLDALF